MLGLPRALVAVGAALVLLVIAAAAPVRLLLSAVLIVLSLAVGALIWALG